MRAVVSFLGSANVQKLFGIALTAVSGATAVNGKTLSAHVAGMTIGAAFTAFVHAIDAVRAAIAKKPEPAAVPTVT